MAENILVVGSGAREHALVWKLAQSGRVGRIYCAPGNAGIGALAEILPVMATDVDGILHEVSRRRIDLTVVGPEAPLARGLADHLRAHEYPVFGPGEAGARIESSKLWAKEIMAERGVPTAHSVRCDTPEQALDAIYDAALPIVIKADGLAAGKGVVICDTREEAETAVREMMVDGALGAAGKTLLIEEFLSGMEVSLLALTDGETTIPLLPACDYKRIGDGETGPNTGGMGAYAPPGAIDGAMVERLTESVFQPVLAGMRERGITYQGVLYAGIILTGDGPKVLEFNCRFGDPETQVILPLLESDLLDLFQSVARGRLDGHPALSWHAGACVCVVLASGGYPGKYVNGKPIHGLDALPEGGLIFHAGTSWSGEQLVTDGGRVLSAIGAGPDMATARDLAYATADAITFEGKVQRGDIAARELA